MKTRHKVMLLIVGVVALAAAYALTRPVFSMPYGMVPLRVGDQQLYVKFHDCGAICSSALYLTPNPDRCARENDKTDLLVGELSYLEFAVKGNTLSIVGDNWHIPGPLPFKVEFIPDWGHAREHYSLQYISFEGPLPQDRAAESGSRP